MKMRKTGLFIGRMLLSLVALYSLAACATIENYLPGAAAINPCTEELVAPDLFRDEFESADQSCGWATFDRGSEAVGIRDNGMHIAVSSPGNAAWTHINESFNDVKINVQTRQLIGTNNNGYGVICRYLDRDNYYIFLISGDGYYAIGKFESGINSIQYLTGAEPNHFIPSDAIITGASANRLEVVCEGDQLSLEINGVVVDTVRDSAHASGSIGLIATTFEANSVQVQIEFDNVVVTEP